jgi:carbon-monoxide dehydrogenase large subunit
MVHVAFVRSVHAHALISALELDAARHAPGVVAVLTGEDTGRLCKPCRGVLLHYQGMKAGAMRPLAVERVRYVGEPVVAIAAETRAAAEDACARVRIDWTPLPAVLSAEQAVAAGAPLIHADLPDNVIYDTRLSGGDAAVALGGGHRVWRRRFTTGRHTGVPIEPRSLVADFEPATRSLTLWMSTQVPHMMQAVLADLFGVAEHRVRVIAPDVGGSFGIKIHVYQDDLAAIAMALTLGRPVKWVATRRESFLSDIHAREQVIEIEVAADTEGVVRGMRAHITAAVGPYSAYPRSSVVEGGQVLRLLPGPYRIRDYEGTLRVVAQHKVITSQYRAVGHPIAAAVTESMLDQIARDLALDPAEIRRRNLVPQDQMPWTSPTGNVYDSGSYHRALARLLETAGYEGLRAEQARQRASGRHTGIGLACFIELTGPGAQFYGVGGAPISGQDGATLRMEPSGAVTALVGVTNQGQGTPTALAQIIGDELALSIDAISVLSGDTAMTPYGRRHVGQPGHADRRQRHAARGPGAGRQDPSHRRHAPRGAPRRRRAGRRARGHPRHGAGPELRRPGANSPLPVQRAQGARAKPGGDRALHERAAVDLHQRRPPGRRRGGRGYGPRQCPQVRGGGRLRAHRQPGAGRGADRRRCRPGPGRRALRALRL